MDDDWKLVRSSAPKSNALLHTGYDLVIQFNIFVLFIRHAFFDQRPLQVYDILLDKWRRILVIWRR